jgi:DNA-binding transcriptional LysR family regulator
MELHQLRYALAVLDTGSFTAAAARVRVSQSGVSAQVQKLERELGVVLFDRSGRRVEVTAEGARLVPALRAAVEAVDRVRDVASELHGLVVGALRVGTVAGLTWPVLFDAIAEIHSAHPGVDLRLREATSDVLVDGVRRREFDLAIAAWSPDPPDGLETATIFDDALVAVVAPGHPWSARRAIRPAELAHVDLIALSPGTGARLALDATLTRAGITIPPRWEVGTPAYLETLARRGLGVGIASVTTIGKAAGLVSIAIDDPRARSQLGIVWRADHGPATHALLSRLVTA